jgi:hypothetical protein
MIPNIAAENNASRGELASAIEKLSAKNVWHEGGATGTASSLLCHLAFWDRWALHVVEAANGPDLGAFRLTPKAIDSVNDAVATLAGAIPADIAARLALETAAAVDARVLGLEDDSKDRIAAAGLERVLARHIHRREHLPPLIAASAVAKDDIC